jgi:hypothetical protein
VAGSLGRSLGACGPGGASEMSLNEPMTRAFDPRGSAFGV